jgi:predicted  nucleic acid-binding Zn-ribbon protein
MPLQNRTKFAVTIITKRDMELSVKIFPLVFIITVLLADQALAFDCGAARQLREKYQRNRDSVQREIDRLKSEKQKSSDKLNVLDPELEKRVEKLKEKIRKISSKKTDEMDERLKQLEVYQMKKIELEQGFYCSECMRLKSDIEKNGRESFDAHIRKVKGKRLDVPLSVTRKLYEDMRKMVRISEQKCFKLDEEKDALYADINDIKNQWERDRVALAARITQIDQEAHRKAQDATPMMADLTRLEIMMRENSCF